MFYFSDVQIVLNTLLGPVERNIFSYPRHAFLPGFEAVGVLHTDGQCFGSMPFWWIMDMDADPDPALFIIDLQDANKKIMFFLNFLAYYFSKVHLHHFSRKKVIKKSRFFLLFLLNNRRIWIQSRIQIHTSWLVDPDPDQRGPKTWGSGGSGSGSATLLMAQGLLSTPLNTLEGLLWDLELFPYLI